MTLAQVWDNLGLVLQTEVRYYDVALKSESVGHVTVPSSRCRRTIGVPPTRSTMESAILGRCMGVPAAIMDSVPRGGEAERAVD